MCNKSNKAAFVGQIHGDLRGLLDGLHASLTGSVAVGSVVRQLREQRGWTQAELGEKVGGLDPSVIGRKERGVLTIKPPERDRFAKAFGLSLREFDELWRAASIERTSGGPGIPVINRAPAGQVVDYEEYGVDSGQGMEYIDWGDVGDDLAFAVIAVGDSMAPAVAEGDYLVFSSMGLPKPRAELKEGSVVFVRFGPESSVTPGGCLVARWFKLPDGSIRLNKDNPRYQPLACRPEDIQQLAVCIERRTKRV